MKWILSYVKVYFDAPTNIYDMSRPIGGHNAPHYLARLIRQIFFLNLTPFFAPTVREE